MARFRPRKSRFRRHGRAARLWQVALLFLGLAPLARAGGGPENVLLVVNQNSWASQTIANHWSRLRQIPANNIVYLDWQGTLEVVPVETFRQQILTPILTSISRRGLNGQIDYVIYSSDFPYAVDCQADLGSAKLPQNLKPICSLNGLTYLWETVLTKSPAYCVDLKSNQYMRRAVPAQEGKPTHGFRSWYGWGPNGELLEAGGKQYLLSMMLGVTCGRGNSVTEVVDYLTRSAAADGTRPQGTMYFMRTNDVRTTTRAPAFEPAVRTLDELGVSGQIVTRDLPQGKADVLGAMLGVPKYSWSDSQSTILPGAICENLTSTSGVMQEAGGQTPLSEILRHGAAATSGTVTEPLAIQDKFPFPFLQVHYARGATAAEAFYQSVFGPYQLLIVGDPLCQPFARIPVVRVDGAQPGAELKGTVELTPSATVEGAGAAGGVDRFELFVDGQRRGACAAGEKLRLDTTRYGDGYHELRVVGIDRGPIETQGRAVFPITINNQGRRVAFTGAATSNVPWSAPLVLRAECERAERVVIAIGSRIVGNLNGAGGEIRLDPRVLGLGPVRLQALAFLGSGARDLAYSEPLDLTIEPLPRLAPAVAESFDSLKPGLRVWPEIGGSKEVATTSARDWLEKAGIKPGGKYRLETTFLAPRDDVFQLQLRHAGPIRVTIDDQVVLDEKQVPRDRQIPFSAASGVHRLKIEGVSPNGDRPLLKFGGPGLSFASKSVFRYVP